MEKYIKYLERRAIRKIIRFVILLLIGYCALHLASCDKNPNTDTGDDYCEVQPNGEMGCE